MSEKLESMTLTCGPFEKTCDEELAQTVVNKFIPIKELSDYWFGTTKIEEERRWKQFCDAWLIIGGFNILVTALSKAHAREKNYPAEDLPHVIQANINTYCKCAFDWMPVGESVLEDESE